MPKKRPSKRSESGLLALWIILAILALLGLLCCLSGVLYVDIGETTRVQVGIAGLRYTLVDTREESPRQKVKALKREQKRKEKQARKEAKQKRKAAKQRAKAQKKKAQRAAHRAKQGVSTSAPAGGKAGSAQAKTKSGSGAKASQEDGFTATVKEVVALLRRCFPNARFLLRHLRFRRVTIAINVGAQDAHTTAIRYGQVQAGVNTTLGLLAGYGADVKLNAVCIQPDFITGEFRQWISFRVKLRLGVIIIGGLGILGKVIGHFLAKESPDNPPSRPAPSSQPTHPSAAGQAVNQENAR